MFEKFMCGIRLRFVIHHIFNTRPNIQITDAPSMFHAVQARKARYAMNGWVSFFRLYRVSCIQSVSCKSKLIVGKKPHHREIYHDERVCV